MVEEKDTEKDIEMKADTNKKGEENLRKQNEESKVENDEKSTEKVDDSEVDIKESSNKNKKDKHVFAVPGLPPLSTLKKPPPPVDNIADSKEQDGGVVDDSEDKNGESSSSTTAKSSSTSSPSLAKKFPLEEPPWGGIPPQDLNPPYSMTILKDGTVKDTVDLANKSRFVFGRNDDCDVRIEHPSCSRYHAVLQYCVVEKDLRKKGFYLYDMGSTHGTYLNKMKIKPKSYNRVRVGYQLKFGGSTRLYIIEVRKV